MENSISVLFRRESTPENVVKGALKRDRRLEWLRFNRSSYFQRRTRLFIHSPCCIRCNRLFIAPIALFSRSNNRSGRFFKGARSREGTRLYLRGNKGLLRDCSELCSGSRCSNKRSTLDTWTIGYWLLESWSGSIRRRSEMCIRKSLRHLRQVVRSYQ